MSSMTIAALVLGAVFILLILGYLNSAMEKNKLHKARQKAEVVERQQRIQTLAETLPQQFKTSELDQLLQRVELHLAEKILADEPASKKIEARILQLKEQLELGAGQSQSGSKVNLGDESQIKEVRFILESLQTQLVRAAQERILSAAEIKSAVAHIQLQLINLYLDYFRNTGQRLMQQGQPRQAKIFYERGVKLIRRQTSEQFRQQLDGFLQLLAGAEKAVEQQNQQSLGQGNQLAGEVDSAENEEAWKKKQLYD